jgi:hypothetical protein
MKVLSRLAALAALIVAICVSVIIVRSPIIADVQGRYQEQGEPPVNLAGRQVLAWANVAGEKQNAALLAFIALAALGAFAAWSEQTLLLAACALLCLSFSYLTGFSIGMGYLPAAGLLLLAWALRAVPRRWMAR